MTDQLFPRDPRRMRQPKKEALREAVTVLTDEMIRLRTENERLRRGSWWRRLLKRIAA